MTFDTGGDGSAYVKYSGGNIVIGAGNADKFSVTPGGLTVAADINMTNNDVNAAGGYHRDHRFIAYNVKQSSNPFMTASVFDFSGTAAQGNGVRLLYTRVPVTRNGSITAVALLTQNCTVKSGSLSASVLVNGTFAGSVGMNTGTIAYATFTKDTYPITAGQYFEVVLTASSGYLTDTDPTSGSFLGLVSVEY